MEGNIKENYSNPDENEREKCSGGSVEVMSMPNTAEITDVVMTGAR